MRRLCAALRCSPKKLTCRRPTLAPLLRIGKRLVAFISPVFESVALTTPIHGLSYVITAKSRLLRVVCIVLIAVGCWLTVKEFGELLTKFEQEPLSVETTLVRRPYFNYSNGFLCINLNKKQLAELVLRRYAKRGSVGANFSIERWHSPDEAILPETSNDASIFYVASALLHIIFVAERNIEDLSREGRMSKFDTWPTDGSWGALFGLPQKRGKLEAIASTLRQILKSSRVSVDHLRRTLAVLACVAAEPEVLHDGGSVGADRICTKRNVALDSPCPDREKKQVSMAFRFPPRDDALIAAYTRRLLVAVKTRGMAVKFSFSLQFARSGLASLGAEVDKSIRGGVSTASCELPALTRKRKEPILRSFAKRGSPPCREPTESTRQCNLRCTHALVESVCKCQLTLHQENVNAGERNAMCARWDGVDALSGLAACFRHIQGYFRNTTRWTEEVKPCLDECVYWKNCMRLAAPYGVFAATPICSLNAPDAATATAFVNLLTFASPVNYIFEEAAAMDSTTLTYIIGGTLGTWIGATFIAIFHFATSVVVAALEQASRKVQSAGVINVHSAVDSDATSQREQQPRGNVYYFHFFDDAFNASGCTKLCACALLTICAVMLFRDTGLVVQAYIAEQSSMGIKFDGNQLVKSMPGLCFELVPLAAETSPERCPTERREELVAYYSCFFLFMALEQQVFVPFKGRSASEDEFRNCRKLLDCPSKRFSSTSDLATEICKETNLSATLITVNESGFVQPKSLSCDQLEVKWLGPYAPFHEAVLCWSLLPRPEAVREAWLRLNKNPAEVVSSRNTSRRNRTAVRAFYSDVGVEHLLRTHDDARSTSRIVIRPKTAREIKFEVVESYNQLSLRRKPCVNEKPVYLCEQLWRRNALAERCRYEPILYGEEQTTFALNESFDPRIVECLRNLADVANGSGNAGCAAEVGCHIWCTTMTQYEMEVKEGVSYSVHLSGQVKKFVQFTESLDYPDLESVLASIAGSAGLWIGGSAFALCHVVMLALDADVRRVVRVTLLACLRKRERQRGIELELFEENSPSATAINETQDTTEKVTTESPQMSEPPGISVESTSIFEATGAGKEPRIILADTLAIPNAATMDEQDMDETRREEAPGAKTANGARNVDEHGACTVATFSASSPFVSENAM